MITATAAPFAAFGGNIVFIGLSAGHWLMLARAPAFADEYGPR